MNILFYRLNGIVAERGGISRITANLAKIFREKGCRVWYMGARNVIQDAIYDPNQAFLPNSDEVFSDINIKYLLKFIEDNAIDIIINQFCAPSEHINLLNVCRRQTKVKVIYCFHNSILTPVYNFAYTRQFSAEEHGHPWLFNILNSWVVRNTAVVIYKFRNRKSYRDIIRKNDAIVVLCEGQKDELIRLVGAECTDKTSVIYNSMSVPNNDVSVKKRHVLWVGSFDYQVKRPDNMLRIWKRVESQCPEWELYMLGDGESLEKCKTKAKEWGLHRVVFTGRVNPQNYYKEAEILCTTSVHECFPMVLLEGMYYQLALVAFDSFTSAKLLVEKGGNGKLVKAFDIAEYAETLKKLMQNDDERILLQSKSAIAANRFEEESVFKQWESLFDNLTTRASDISN